MLVGFLSQTIAGCMLIVLTPFFTLISLISLVVQGNPVLFKQERVGFQFKKFKLVKFRTMKNNSPGEVITSKGDSRITPWGSFLRLLKLDEIPQLWNIAKGDMRFIGPRPEVPEFVEKEKFSFLSKVKPGLSDFTSILLRDEADILEKIGGKNAYEKLLPLKIQLAHIYAYNKGLFLDFILVTLTLISIFSQKAAKRFIIYFFIKQYNSELIPSIQEIVG